LPQHKSLLGREVLPFKISGNSNSNNLKVLRSVNKKIEHQARKICRMIGAHRSKNAVRGRRKTVKKAMEEGRIAIGNDESSINFN
jgi:hypothetical protein